MITRVESKGERQSMTDGTTSLEVPEGYVVVPRARLTQAELDSETVFEMLLALHEIRDLGNEQATAIADRALAVYEKHQKQIDELRGVTAI